MCVQLAIGMQSFVISTGIASLLPIDKKYFENAAVG